MYLFNSCSEAHECTSSKRSEDLYKGRVDPLAPGQDWGLGKSNAQRGSLPICSFTPSSLHTGMACTRPLPLLTWLSGLPVGAVPGSLAAVCPVPVPRALCPLDPEPRALCGWLLLSPWGKIIFTSSVFSLQARMDPSVMQQLLRCGEGCSAELPCLCSPLIAPHMLQVEGTNKTAGQLQPQHAQHA